MGSYAIGKRATLSIPITAIAAWLGIGVISAMRSGVADAPGILGQRAASMAGPSCPGTPSPRATENIHLGVVRQVAPARR